MPFHLALRGFMHGDMLVRFFVLRLICRANFVGLLEIELFGETSWLIGFW